MWTDGSHRKKAAELKKAWTTEKEDFKTDYESHFLVEINCGLFSCVIIRLDSEIDLK